MCWKFDFHHNLVLLCQWLIWKIKFYLKFMRNFRNLSFRSSLPEALCKKGVLRNFTKLTGKHLCQRLFFNKAAGLRPATLLKKTLWHRCFPVNFVKFLRIHRRATASKNHQKMPYERICLHWSCRFRSFNTTKSELFCVYFSEFFPLFSNTYFKELIFKDCFHNLFLQSISSVL